jgi:spore maturation protein CgeB
MRFLLTSYEYPQFMRWLYERDPQLATQPYEQQLHARMAQGFLWSDFYSRNLRLLGHEAQEVVPHNVYLQYAWAKEHGVRTGKRWRMGLRGRRIPWLFRVEDPTWFERILLAQIRAYRPDVLYVRDVTALPVRFVRELRQYVRLIVGQHAARLDTAEDCSGCFDLILSSLPNQVDYFRQRGIKSEHLRLGFETSVLDRLLARPKSIDASFVGKIGGDHSTRAKFVEELVANTGVQLWGAAEQGLSESARSRIVGPAWGIDMYQVLRDSRLTINQHEWWAQEHANNLRLYEATGVGTLVITDAKSDLATLFEPGREVAVYRSTQECRELVDYFLAHPAEREAVAAAGQQRTLREHTYAHRMEELLGILHRFV